MVDAQSESSVPVLEVSSPHGEVTRFALGSSPLVIGRLSDCDIQLDGQRVSRRHAELACENGQWIIRDMDSRNHTRVNGDVVDCQPIGKSDLIEIGQFKLRIFWPEDQVKENDSRTTDWSLEDTEATDFRTLASSPAQRLDASHLTKVNSLSQRLLEIADPRERMIEVCRALVGADMSCKSAVVVRIAKASGAQPLLLCGWQLRHGQEHVPGISRAVVEAVVAGQQPVLVGGAVSSGLTVHFSEADRGITAIIACPLHSAVAYTDILYTTVAHECGTPDWLTLVTLAGEQFKKAELQIEARQTTQDNAAIQHELKRARKIQMSLVPKHPSANGLEVAIGFEPCLWIGGDYANVIGAPDGRVNLIVADVSGKGLPAAMVATGVHSVVDSSIREGKTLEEMALDLNHFLINSMDRQSHLTMLAVLYDPATGAAQYLNAGHPPIMVARPDGDVRQLNYGQNPPLGVVPTSPTIDQTLLERGELLFLYTDGLTEMYDAREKMLMQEGVRRQLGELYRGNENLPLGELRDRLTHRLDEIRGPSPVTDDRTFLLARRA